MGIDAIRALTPDEADAHPTARVRGIVIRSTPSELYIQNEASALFVAPDRNRKEYQRGDYIEVVGRTAAGHFLPVLIEDHSVVLGHKPLPQPVAADLDSLASGKLDCLYVEVVGVVRAIEAANPGELRTRLAVAGGDLRVDIRPPDQRRLKLVGARVKFRGVAAGVKNQLRQIVQPVVLVQESADDIEILNPPIDDVFAAPSQPISSVMSAAEFSKKTALTKVNGQVVSAPSPTRGYVRDATDTIEVTLQAPTDWHVGDLVDVAGFPEIGLTKPRIVDGFARVVGHGAQPIPFITTVGRLLSRDSDATLVQIIATVRHAYDSGGAVTFSLNDEDIFFTATCPKVSGGAASPLPEPGTRVSLVGICSVDRMESTDSLLTTPKSFYIKMRGPEDLRVIQKPGFWTTRRLIGALSGLSCILLLASGWIWSLRNTVRRQTGLILSQTRLQATNEERGRIARELHDSIEQQLAGTTILLDATASAWDEAPGKARSNLDTARAMLRYSLDEAQRVVLNLRSRDLAHACFSDAMESSLRQIVAPSSMQLTVEVRGAVPSLDLVTENHVLRVAQEAVTNAVKHSRASYINVVIEANEDALTLIVSDDGRGFLAHGGQANGKVGKFGLIGMQERAEKLRGFLNIESRPGRGTVVRLTIHPGNGI